MDTVASTLETKYGGLGEGKQKEPTEEEFQKAKNSLLRRSEDTSARRKKARKYSWKNM